MLTNEKAITKNKIIAIVQLCLAGLILFMFGLSTVMCIGDAELAADGFWQACLIFDALGLWLVYCGVKRNRMIVELRKYERIAGVAPGVNFESFSPLVGQSAATIKKNFEWMIRKHFFTDAFIDHEAGCVIFKMAYMNAVAKAQQEEQVEYVSVACACCNGTTKVIKGKSGTCEYCGAHIEA